MIGKFHFFGIVKILIVVVEVYFRGVMNDNSNQVTCV